LKRPLRISLSIGLTVVVGVRQAQPQSSDEGPEANLGRPTVSTPAILTPDSLPFAKIQNG
jgi:hypothetical protein